MNFNVCYRFYYIDPYKEIIVDILKLFSILILECQVRNFSLKS